MNIPFLDSLEWTDAKEYPITLGIWMFLVILLPAEGYWVDLVFLATGGIILASTLDYKGKIQGKGVVMKS